MSFVPEISSLPAGFFAEPSFIDVKRSKNSRANVQAAQVQERHQIPDVKGLSLRKRYSFRIQFLFEKMK